MRTTPLAQWREQASKFDAMIRNAIEKILGFPMDDATFAQACLTPRLGGLGLRKVVEHADLAYHASWHEAKKVEKKTTGLLPLTYLLTICPRKTPRLTLTRRCTAIQSTKLTLVEHSDSAAQLSHT